MKSKKTFTGRIIIGLILSLFAIVTTSSFADEFNGAGVPQAEPSLGICEEGTVAPGIESLGDRVLLYCGNGGNCGEGLVGITNLYVSMGVTVDTLFAFPADLSVYKLIFLIMPHAAFSVAETSVLDTFVRDGGRLVLLSDWPGFYNGHAVLNTLLNILGVPIQVNAAPVDVGCEQFTSNIVADQITDGIASFEYGYTDTLTVLPPAKVLVETKDGSAVTVAVGQPPGAQARPGADVVVAGDSNSFTDLCNPAVNEDFWWNLYNFVRLIDVLVDIKPGSCPNPLNTKSKGVLPVALLGTDGFDVTTIDPVSICLSREVGEEVAPIRSDLEDVATPFGGELCDCHDLNGDGYLDLTLKFSTQELVQALELQDVIGETIPLTLTGNLQELNGNTPIIGADCIWVNK